MIRLILLRICFSGLIKLHLIQIHNITYLSLSKGLGFNTPPKAAKSVNHRVPFSGWILCLFLVILYDADSWLLKYFYLLEANSLLLNLPNLLRHVHIAHETIRPTVKKSLELNFESPIKKSCRYKIVRLTPLWMPS